MKPRVYSFPFAGERVWAVNVVQGVVGGVQIDHALTFTYTWQAAMNAANAYAHAHPVRSTHQTNDRSTP